MARPVLLISKLVVAQNRQKTAIRDRASTIPIFIMHLAAVCGGNKRDLAEFSQIADAGLSQYYNADCEILVGVLCIFRSRNPHQSRNIFL
jgi:uncharacterized membrane protein YadS